MGPYDFAPRATPTQIIEGCIFPEFGPSRADRLQVHPRKFAKLNRTRLPQHLPNWLIKVLGLIGGLHHLRVRDANDGIHAYLRQHLTKRGDGEAIVIIHKRESLVAHAENTRQTDQRITNEMERERSAFAKEEEFGRRALSSEKPGQGLSRRGLRNLRAQAGLHKHFDKPIHVHNFTCRHETPCRPNLLFLPPPHLHPQLATRRQNDSNSERTGASNFNELAYSAAVL